MRYSSRFEYKYIISPSDYYAIKHAMRPFIELDDYTRLESKRRYLVRSVYYDTFDLRAFHERNDGQYGRIKLRVRAYAKSADDADVVSVELKTKRGSSMTKYSALIPVDEYLTFLETGSFPTLKNPVVDEFERLRRIRNLEPQIIVQYRREGWRGRLEKDLRITFDHGVESARAKTLFDNESTLFKLHRPKNIILEIKCTMKRPDWLRRIIKQYDLKVITNSKYVQGIEVVRPHMVTPREEVPRHTKG